MQIWLGMGIQPDVNPQKKIIFVLVTFIRNMTTFYWPEIIACMKLPYNSNYNHLTRKSSGRVWHFLGFKKGSMLIAAYSAAQTNNKPRGIVLIMKTNTKMCIKYSIEL